ncbi:Actin cytoskeleton-regulatory complex protein END3 [Smittium culicis]|uniref:Actin cytoskeleton-regulatory complex protein END3 n=1 Tax=Smittium culicis TaxID=133412 RepID=A0A1R1Y1N9_9FUNG|nr:Actin cytoskeleton-regulatory complex protein END3 [Smittium culicis]OMJ24736.1 Actin cytoskeleton-regulatory complex protein END3 [Smittium culicis]
MDFVLLPDEKQKYTHLFSTYGPQNNKLSGDVCRSVFTQSGLPIDKLKKVWDLSDIDKDGFLDLNEFCIAMKLIKLLLTGNVSSLPNVLPNSMLPFPLSNQPSHSTPEFNFQSISSPPVSLNDSLFKRYSLGNSTVSYHKNSPDTLSGKYSAFNESSKSSTLADSYLSRIKSNSPLNSSQKVSSPLASYKSSNNISADKAKIDQLKEKIIQVEKEIKNLNNTQSSHTQNDFNLDIDPNQTSLKGELELLLSHRSKVQNGSLTFVNTLKSDLLKIPNTSSPIDHQQLALSITDQISSLESLINDLESKKNSVHEYLNEVS